MKLDMLITDYRDNMLLKFSIDILYIVTENNVQCLKDLFIIMELLVGLIFLVFI